MTLSAEQEQEIAASRDQASRPAREFPHIVERDTLEGLGESAGSSYSARDCDGHPWSFGTYDPYAGS
jgi:hypothetical protein